MRSNNFCGEESLVEPDGPGRDMEEQQMSKKDSAWRSYHCKASRPSLHTPEPLQISPTNGFNGNAELLFRLSITVTAYELTQDY